MKSLDPEQNGSYKFLEREQVEEIIADIACKSVSKEMEKRIKPFTDKQHHKQNLVKAINTRVIPVASYVMNQLNDLDKIIKK